MGRPLRPIQGHKDLQTPPTGGLKNIKPLNDNLIQNRIQGFRFSSGNLTRKVPENIPYATFSSFFMMEKMNKAESRQSTMSTLHTIHNSMPPHR